MNRPTLSTFRAQFPTEVMGICQADPQVATFCNMAQDRLLMDPMTPDEGWWGGWVSMLLSGTVTNGATYVTTPREICRLIVMAVCQKPIAIRNGFYEYLQFGRGLQPKTCQGQGCGSTLQAYERDTVPTLAPFSSDAQTIRIYPTDSRDAGLRVLLKGTDNNDLTILTTDPGTGLSAPGEYLSLTFPFVDSANLYNSITGIQKDETYGPLQFFSVDPTTTVETALSSMLPNEGVANYRRYLINGIPNSNLCCYTAGQPLQMEAQGRLDFVPVANETDYLTIQNVPALLEEAISIKYSRMDSGNAAQQSMLHHQRALQYLNGQLDAYEGKISTAVKVPIFGSNRLRRQPV